MKLQIIDGAVAQEEGQMPYKDGKSDAAPDPRALELMNRVDAAEQARRARRGPEVERKVEHVSEVIARLGILKH